MSLLGKRYYERMNDSASNDAAAGDDDNEEDDYLSDKILAEIEQVEAKSKKGSGANKTYSQLRKEAAKRAEEKGYIKPRAEREREAREEGLKRNILLMPDSTGTTAASSSYRSTNAAASTSREGSNDEIPHPPPSHGGNKALAMMMKMGFKPGEALGKKVEDTSNKGKGRASAQVAEDSDAEESEESSVLSGLGARKGLEDFISINVDSEDEDAPPPTHAPRSKPNIPGHRIDPIAIQMRSGRGGLGVEEAKRRKISEAASKERQTESLDDYRSRVRSNHAEKRAEGQLKSVRETCISLDEREGIKYNHLWLDPLEEYHKEREKQLGARSRFRIKERDGLGGEFDDDDNEFGDDQSRGVRRNGMRDNLDEELELDGDLEDLNTEEMEKREAAKEQFLRLSATERLKTTLDYLRNRHHYCFWCGTAYANAEQLATECPGEDEDDH
ncbi:hypothetical protein P389DRAFT_67124 [Cystobasidium minutum MCA 4210]|uniref:uncharacterized protein n=1 Tax=Cystobasidium minutum MCA 4210 TaxID=1397322 RepID=UPI0034CED8C6|eukprot:jgi/Rhomi1/67124/CE67123_180